MTELSWQHRRAVGFAYILSNPGLRPGLLKIGSTSMLSEDRAKHLFTTGVPDEFDVVFRRLVSHPERRVSYAARRVLL